MDNLSPNAKAVLDLVEIHENGEYLIVLYNGYKRTLTKENLDAYLCGIYANLHQI